MKVYAGLDGGSTYLKAALLDEHKRVIRTGVTSTGIDNNASAKKLLAKLMSESGVGQVSYTMATGYSRKILEVADDDVSEITAHAYGVRVTAPKAYKPGMIVDIGGQDSKIIYLVENENAIAREKQKKSGFQEGNAKAEGFATGDSGQQLKQKGHNHMKNTLEESRYFIAVENPEGGLFLGAGSKETDYSEEELLAIAKDVFDANRLEGKTGSYSYKVTEKADGSKTAVFLNCESKYAEVATLAVISASACVAGILLAWLLVSLLSNQAIKPMVKNIERQKQFITDAGHELKTPLTVISANMDVLSMDMGTNEWVQGTQKQVANMRKLVNELIYLSRMDEADSHLERSSFNFSDAVQDVAAPFAGMAEFSGKNLVVSTADNLIISGDEQALRRLVSTLCENAVKYAPEDSNIDISLTRTGKSIVFQTENAVREPLNDEAISHLFDRFYRGDASRSKEENSGFGIGLSIARAITEKHGGTIKARMSENGRLQIICTLPEG